MFGFVGKLVEVTVKTVVTPVAIVADIATLGGALTDKKEPYTISHIKDIHETMDEIGD